MHTFLIFPPFQNNYKPLLGVIIQVDMTKSSEMSQSMLQMSAAQTTVKISTVEEQGAGSYKSPWEDNDEKTKKAKDKEKRTRSHH